MPGHCTHISPRSWHSRARGWLGLLLREAPGPRVWQCSVVKVNALVRGHPLALEGGTLGAHAQGQ